MKSLSVIVAVLLLVLSQALAARLKKAGLLPADQQPAIGAAITNAAPSSVTGPVSASAAVQP